MQPEAGVLPPFQKAARICAAASAVFAILTLAGWAANHMLLASFSSSFIPMAQSTAIAFLLSAASLLLFHSKNSGKYAGVALASIVAFLSILKLLHFVHGNPFFDPESWLFESPGKFGEVPLARISPVAAIGFLFTSAGLISMWKPWLRWCGVFGFAALLLCSAVLLGYLYGTPLLYGGNIIPMGFTSSLAFLFLGSGIVASAGPDRFPLRPFLGESVHAKLLRAFLPIVVVAVVADNAAFRFFKEEIAVNPAFFSAVIALAFSLVLVITIAPLSYAIGKKIELAEAGKKEAEAALFERQRNLALLFSRNPGPMWVYSLESHYFLEVNEAAVSRYGYSRDEFLKMKISDILALEENQNIAGTKGAADKGSEPEYMGQQRHKLKAGRVIDVEIISHSLTFDGQRAMLVIANDVTTRKKAEQNLRESHKKLKETLKQLKEAQDQLVHHENLRVLGTMASGIAHDFNNSLSPILGYSDLLAEHPEMLKNHEKTLHALQTIRSAAQDAGKVVARLRDFYKKREGAEPFGPVDLGALVRQSIELSEPRWKSQALMEEVNIKIVSELSETPHVMGSESQIREVLMNLIFNAIDAMPDGGIITIRTLVEDHLVFLEVQDTGLGMTEEVQAQCFKPFFSTKGENGTGLGLSMAAEIMKQHRGSISVNSAPGKGTRFTLTFPALRSVAQFNAEPAGLRSRSSLRILLIDDEAAVREIFSEYLTTDGHQVETASNGKEGLEKFDPSLFDLVIVDKAMPEMSGEKLARAIKKLSLETPIILLTGSADIAAGEISLEHIDFVLKKPLTLAAMREALAKVGEKLASVRKN